MKREFSAGGTVFRADGKEPMIVLIKDHNGKWTLPKGMIEKGETSEQAAVREVEEETGIKNPEVLVKLGNIQYFYKRKGETILKTNTFFLMKTGQEKLKKSWEVQDVKWFTASEALKKIEYRNADKILENAIEMFGKINEEAKK